MDHSRMGGRRRPPEGGAPGRKPARVNPNVIEITRENASFSVRGGFLYMQSPKDAEPVRVMLHRDFPFEFLWEYISVLDVDGYELAFIRTLDIFDGEEREMLVRELERKYYSPVIKKIYSVKERFGFSYWDADTTGGRLTFTLQDTFRSIVKTGEGRLFLFDVDGNRFVIEDVEKLDRKSHKKLELYL